MIKNIYLMKSQICNKKNFKNFREKKLCFFSVRERNTSTICNFAILQGWTDVTCFVMPAVKDLIKLYFSGGFNNKEILVILAQNHCIIISIKTLKRHCCKLCLFRRKHHTDLDEVIAFVYQELQCNRQMQGYHWLGYMPCA